MTKRKPPTWLYTHPFAMQTEASPQSSRWHSVTFTNLALIDPSPRSIKLVLPAPDGPRMAPRWTAAELSCLDLIRRSVRFFTQIPAKSLDVCFWKGNFDPNLGCGFLTARILTSSIFLPRFCLFWNLVGTSADLSSLWMPEWNASTVPAVRCRFRRWIANFDSPYCFFASPLFVSGSYSTTFSCLWTYSLTSQHMHQKNPQK